MVRTPLAYRKYSLSPTWISTYSPLCLTYMSLSFIISPHSSLCHTYENISCLVLDTRHTHTLAHAHLLRTVLAFYLYILYFRATILSWYLRFNPG